MSTGAISVGCSREGHTEEVMAVQVENGRMLHGGNLEDVVWQ